MASTQERVATLRAADGYALRYRVWSPPEPTSTMILLSGVMSHSEWLRPIAEPLAQSGLRVVGADRRGSGMNRAQRGDAPSQRALLDDLEKIIATERGGGHLYLLGWCWGSILAINAALELDLDLSGLILAAPGLHPSEALRKRLQAPDPNLPRDQANLPVPITEEMFTQGPALEGFIRKDALRLQAYSPRFQGIMTKLNASAVARLDRLELPMLVILAEHDVTIDHAATMRTLKALDPKQVTIAHCDAAHGMQFEAADEVTAHILGWLEQH